MDIKLSNGNVTSRILPLKIHDLHQEDATVLENELGGTLRAIDFIYKEPGVNRPLKPLDNKNDNQSKTDYKNQVNKVANAVNETLRGIKEIKVSTTANETLILQSARLPFRNKFAGRSILRTSIVYLLTPLIFWKVVVISSGLFNLTEGTVQFITLVLIVLFPVAMVMAWLYERSPRGFIGTGSVASLDNPYTDERKKPFTGIISIALLLLTSVTLFLLNPQIGKTQSMNSIKDVEKSIAVLPFVNDSPDQENAYFINGIMEEVLNNLQAIIDFRILSRTSTDQYKGQDRPAITEIAKKLNVNFIVEGSGQKYGNMFRLRVQLIMAKGKETHLWAKSYDQEIRETEDIFSIQSQVAESIASELRVIIKPEEKILLKAIPTSDLKALDYYLRGKDYKKRSFREDDINYAIQMFEKAVEIDPGFALAWVGLAECSRDLFWYYHDRSEENLSMIKKYLDKASALSPKLKEVRLEEACYYYHCKLDYSRRD